jgi:hypothetical protein
MNHLDLLDKSKRFDMEVNLDEYVTLREASNMFGKSQSMLRKIHYNNEIQSVKRNNMLYVNVKDLEKLYGERVVTRATSARPLIIDTRKPELRNLPQPTQPLIQAEPIKEVFSNDLVDSLKSQIDSLKNQIYKMEQLNSQKELYYQSELQDSKIERQDYMSELSRQIQLFNEKWDREQVLHLKQTESNQRLMESNRVKDMQINQLLIGMQQQQKAQNRNIFQKFSHWLNITF